MTESPGSRRVVRNVTARLAAAKYKSPHPDPNKEVPLDPPNYEEDPYLALLWAKDMWWRRIYTVNEICRLTRMPVHRLKKQLVGNKNEYGWVEEREKVQASLLRRTIQNDQARIDSLLQNILSVLEESTAAIMANGEGLTVEQYGKFIDSFDKLFKVRQLIIGSPTQIYGGDMTWEKVLEKLRQVDIIEYKGHVKNVIEVEVNGNGAKLLPTPTGERDS